MLKDIKKLFNIVALLAIGSLTLISCESDADMLGSQFFQNGAEGIDDVSPVIAYNVYNNDSLRIRTDGIQADSVVLGAFKDSQFGLQKSAYVTQVRLSSYAPDFGANPVLDSAVLSIVPNFRIDSATTTTNENYIFPDGAVPAKKVVSTYPVKKYGNTKIGGKTVFNIKVHEVTDFLYSRAEKFYSDKVVGTGALLGSTVFKGDVNLVQVTKKSDNSSLLDIATSLRVKMDSAYFQNNIIKKASSPELADVASFIRYMKGMKISVDENDGYLFKFSPNSVTLKLYYKKDNVANGVTTRVPSQFSLDMGASNVHYSHIEFQRGNTPSYAALNNPNRQNGDPRIYAQGMGGGGVGIRIPATKIDELRNLYNNNKIGIVTAKLRIYTDLNTWNNTYEKPRNFLVRQREVKDDGTFQDFYSFMADMSALGYSGNFLLVKPYELNHNPAYYDIGITQTFKDIIENKATNKDFILNVGSYTTDASGVLYGTTYSSYGAQNFNNRSYTPNRAVIVGTDAQNANSAKLIVRYGKKL